MSHIYILSNDGMPGLVKIGMTSSSPINRSKELYTTGVPCSFHVEASWRVPHQNMREAERELHELLSEYRYNEKREFFTIEPDDAVEFVDSYISDRGYGADLISGFADKILLISTVLLVITGALFLL